MGNSVIYRPAYDAEVEYLESSGTQYIDTGVIPTENTRVVAKLYTEQDANKNWFGSENFGTTSTTGYAFNQMYSNVEYEFGNSGWVTRSLSYSLLSRVFEVDFSKSALIIDGVTIASNLCSYFSTQTLPILLFWRQSNKTAGLISGRVYYLKIYQNSTLVRDFIPVRIGSVGYLYDKVTKQLFANKGTGNFILGNDVSNAVIPQQRCVLYFGNQRSVGFERIYEEYEWLKGDGTARIVKNFNFWQNKLEVEVGDEQGNQFATNYNETGVYLAAVYNSGGGNPYMLVSFRETTSGHIGDVLYSQFPERLSMVFYIDGGIAYCNQNGTLHTGQQLTESVWNKDIPLHIPAKEMVYIRELLPNGAYRSNLIPCKLLQPIPAILDGNGIARQAGECGMWDKVSNRFYGNVANSGTFTVSND